MIVHAREAYSLTYIVDCVLFLNCVIYSLNCTRIRTGRRFVVVAFNILYFTIVELHLITQTFKSGEGVGVIFTLLYTCVRSWTDRITQLDILTWSLACACLYFFLCSVNEDLAVVSFPI